MKEAVTANWKLPFDFGRSGDVAGPKVKSGLRSGPDGWWLVAGSWRLVSCVKVL